MTMQLLVLLLFVSSTLSTLLVKAEQCNDDQLNRCETAITKILESGGGYQRDTREYCRNLYRKLHCLVTQTSLCLSPSERQSKSSIIHKTWRFLGSICDGYAIWWRLDCYQQDGVKHCESTLTDNRSINRESCRNYRQFRECSTLVVRSRCTPEDESLLGIYLLDKGRERAWLCSGDDQDDNYISSAPLSSEYQRDENCEIRVKNEARMCKKHAEDKFRSDKNSNNVSYMDEKCCMMKLFKECVSDLSKRYCGTEELEIFNSLRHEYFGFEHKQCSDSIKCSSAYKFNSIHFIILLIISSITQMIH
ncbi:uncharacterized protein LOC111637229 [Centruroides sculpturatus]|uniref:uncharacterized protein LOC111637229 n=1 Tax=Centruroides sculpturatus TaxID=218467 RepID=UPI000C6EC476|nr:uncharacterized protein LOC111637229 [Centruroides sculpturatus]